MKHISEVLDNPIKMLSDGWKKKDGEMIIQSNPTAPPSLPEGVPTLIGQWPEYLRQSVTVSRFDDNYNQREVPVMLYPLKSIPTDKLEELDDIIKKAEQTLIPATKQQLIQELGRLMLHKGIGNYSESQWKLLMEDYAEDLQDYPLDLVKDACRDCRKNAEMRFFPQIGQFEQLIKWHYAVRKIQLKRLHELKEKTIELAKQSKPRSKSPC